MIRVLIAEDSATCLGLLTEIIATDPRLSLIATANHGAEAVRMTRELRPDVVVMDIHMPVMDGFEATKKIRTLEKYLGFSVPIIGLTGDDVS
jgi:two-component system chemotaxis response regulator CheB